MFDAALAVTAGEIMHTADTHADAPRREMPGTVHLAGKRRSLLGQGCRWAVPLWRREATW
jgi:hypothetical protein